MAPLPPALNNLEQVEGNKQNLSFTSFSDVVVASKLINLGLDVGKNEKEVLGSVQVLKTVERNRLSAFCPRIVEEHDSDAVFLESDEDDDVNNLTLGHLCGDLMEEVMDDDSDHLSCEFETVFKKNKSMSSFNKKNKKIGIVRKKRKSNRSK